MSGLLGFVYDRPRLALVCMTSLVVLGAIKMVAEIVRALT